MAAGQVWVWHKMIFNHDQETEHGDAGRACSSMRTTSMKNYTTKHFVLTLSKLKNAQDEAE
jgi:hypothetical protein